MAFDRTNNGSTHPKKKAHRDITKDPACMERVVIASYCGNTFRSARAVADELGLTVQAVTAVREAAFAAGMFTTVIKLPHEHTEVERLQNAVRVKYGLKEVVLAPGLPAILGELDRERRRNLHTQVIHSMAGRLAEHLDTLLGSNGLERKGFTLGVAWGRTMHLVAEHLLSHPRRVRYDALEVVPIVGITSESNPEPIEANVVAMDIARAYGGRSAQLPCAAFVEALDESMVIRPPQVRRMLKKIQGCDAVLTSMGPIPENEDGAADITLSIETKLNEELFKSALSKDAVGDICYWLVDRHGNEVKTAYTAIGLGFEGLQRIARDPKRQVILVAGGDRWRFEPLRAALRAKLASVLVSDTVTARFLVGEIGL